MKKKKKITKIFIYISCFFLALGIILGVSTLNKEKKIITNKMDNIKSSYHNLSNDIEKYNSIRKEYTNLSNDLILDKYLDSHERFINVLNNYNEVMNDIDSSVKNINKNCTNDFIDKDVTEICNNYEKLYEKLVNIYINDINGYNYKINSYNEYKKDNIALFDSLYKYYIDYNKDGTYEGRENNEKN